MTEANSEAEPPNRQSKMNFAFDIGCWTLGVERFSSYLWKGG
jgi:hypothetical protein